LEKYGNNTCNGNGTFELYYEDGDGGLTKVLSFTDPGVGSWTWWELDYSVLTKKIKLLCTQEDSFGTSRISEIDFKG